MANERGAAALFEIGLCERERLVDPQPGTLEHDDQPAQTVPVDGCAGLAITATISSTRGGSAL